MSFQETPKSAALHNIPNKKLHQQILHLIQGCKSCSIKNIKNIEQTAEIGLCKICSIKVVAYHRYYNANIPMIYWDLKMPTNSNAPGEFKTPQGLVDIYLKSVENLNKSYVDGISFMLAGSHGTGKSMTVTNILKRATHKNFTALYTTISDMVSALTLSPNEDKYNARKELTEADFLVIDEFDGRFFGNSETATDLFGRTFEHAFRTRQQNKLPTIIVSNSPNPLESFNGAIKQSLESLLTKLPLIPILGQDFRKLQGKV